MFSGCRKKKRRNLMKKYKEFHGDVPVDMIGKRLREIARQEAVFKIVTGYGSTTGIQKSKQAALKVLANMVRQNLIVAYLPGEKVYDFSVNTNNIYYKARTVYENVLRSDKDKGNEGIIYVFVK